MNEVIDKDLIFLDTELQTQEALFNYLSEKMVENERAHDAEAIKKGFYQRESEYSTAMNDGIAIPHCRIDEIEKATVIVVRNKNKIVWTDQEEVCLFFALLIPGGNENQIHIKVLAQVAQLIMEDEFIEIVNSSTHQKDIYDYMNVINELI